MDVEEKQVKTSKLRGRPPADKKTITRTTTADLRPALSSREAEYTYALEEFAGQYEENEASVPFDAPSAPTGRSGSFSILLSSLIKNNRSEVMRIARELGVSDNTVYRWMNGTSEPRANHLQHLTEVLLQSLSQGFQSNQSGQTGHYNGRVTNMPGNAGARWDVQKEFYRRVLEQAATTVDDASRRWHIIETVFEYALLHLDPDRNGMALTYARLMPKREDGLIHSLYEAEMRGQNPWPFGLEFKAYLGSTTLAGIAAMRQRVQTWSVKDPDKRTPVGLDTNERSSCAAPVMRGGRLAGVLVVSSALDDFVYQNGVPRAVSDYANLLAAGLMDADFHSVSEIHLGPMPDLLWQREKIARSYLNRVIECARKQCLSLPEAEQKVLRDLEDEFEREALAQVDREEQAKTDIPDPWLQLESDQRSE
jgi:transcriptional regulator with XRE-family HTH domain